MGQIFSGLKLFWKRLSLTCTTMRLWDIGRAKKLYFYHTSSRLANHDLFLTRYSFVLQMNLYRNSTSLTSTSMKIFIDILLSVKRALEKFRSHFPSKLKLCRRKFSPTFYYQTKKFVQFFHHFFSLGVNMSVEISADTAVVMKVKGQYLAVSKTAKRFPRSQTRSPGFVLPQLAVLRTTRYS